MSSKMGCWDSVWFCSSNIGEETRELNSNSGYSFPEHIKNNNNNKKRPFRHENPLNNKKCDVH